jgi:hypothetical protein
VDNSSSFNIKSVKEQAKKLNILNTPNADKGRVMPPMFKRDAVVKSTTDPSHMSNVTDKVDIENIDLSDPKPNEKEWLLAMSRGDYWEISKILSKTPYLAKKKDPFTGYTAAHWACKHGNVEILKLIASTLEAESNSTKNQQQPTVVKIQHLINNKTRSGYTCLHIAYVCGHEHLVPYLKTYGAQGVISDYSGKQAIDYTHNLNETRSGFDLIPDSSDHNRAQMSTDATNHHSFDNKFSTMLRGANKVNSKGDSNNEKGIVVKSRPPLPQSFSSEYSNVSNTDISTNSESEPSIITISPDKSPPVSKYKSISETVSFNRTPKPYTPSPLTKDTKQETNENVIMPPPAIIPTLRTKINNKQYYFFNIFFSFEIILDCYFISFDY